VIKWPGVIKPGTVKNQLFVALDWVPTFVDIAGGPKADGLKKADRGGPISGHRQDHARWLRPARLPRGQVRKIGPRPLLLFLGRNAVRRALKELEPKSSRHCSRQRATTSARCWRRSRRPMPATQATSRPS
jgi:arylsulfatase A-like enzyme